MIKIRKSAEPQELAQNGYSCDAVKHVLISDTDEKCYICERSRDTDFEVEHLKSRRYYPELENDWSNLYAACSYCNKKKGHYHDGMLNPDRCDVEDIIDHKVDLMKEKAVFSSKDGRDSVNSTIKLLTKVFNGTGKPRRELEKLFWGHFKKEYNDFIAVVNDYLAGNQNAEEDIRELLDIREEFLAFKYYVIKSNPILSQVFCNEVIWNK